MAPTYLPYHLTSHTQYYGAWPLGKVEIVANRGVIPYIPVWLKIRLSGQLLTNLRSTHAFVGICTIPRGVTTVFGSTQKKMTPPITNILLFKGEKKREVIRRTRSPET
ncbi:hypothetical protein J6590_072153 [Homalodisca vitripennis]|nr:hypothetical protein J6590_072153 [Homalodisca vitripennis]